MLPKPNRSARMSAVAVMAMPAIARQRNNQEEVGTFTTTVSISALCVQSRRGTAWPGLAVRSSLR